jgi:hypothetical protein
MQSRNSVRGAAAKPLRVVANLSFGNKGRGFPNAKWRGSPSQLGVEPNGSSALAPERERPRHRLSPRQVWRVP